MRYKVRCNGRHHTAILEPIPAITIAGHGDDAADAAERALAGVEALGQGPTGLIPQVAAAAAAAKTLRMIVSFGKKHGREGARAEIEKLPDKAKAAVTSFIKRIWPS